MRCLTSGAAVSLTPRCRAVGTALSGTEFIREGSIPSDKDVLDVPGPSRIKRIAFRYCLRGGGSTALQPSAPLLRPDTQMRNITKVFLSALVTTFECTFESASSSGRCAGVGKGRLRREGGVTPPSGRGRFIPARVVLHSYRETGHWHHDSVDLTDLRRTWHWFWSV